MPVVGTSNLPVAPRDTLWDASAARRRVFEHCTKDGKVNVAGVSRAFLWRDPHGDGREPGSYHLGFCDVIDGVLHIVPNGIALCAGKRGLGSFELESCDEDIVRARIVSVYERVARVHRDWPHSPWAALTADATGQPIEGPIAYEGQETGDGRFIEDGALTWPDLPVALVFDRSEMDHTGATIGTINEIERRDDGVIWGRGNLAESEDPETQLLVLRAAELFAEGAVGVSVSLDDIKNNIPEDPEEEWPEVVKTTAGRIRSVAIVDEAAFIKAKMSLVAAVRQVERDWFTDPGFGHGSRTHLDAGDDERLVWQEPEHPEEQGQYGCPLTITEDGRIYGHAALWYRCHVGYAGTCVRPPKEPAAYRGFLTGERIPGIPTGPLVFKTMHAGNHLSADAAATHYDHTGAAPADLAVGPDAYGIWVAGALRSDVTEEDVEILRSSALSGDWRPVNGRHRLVGILAVNAPGFRVARALAASGALITVGPGCDSCDEGRTFEERLALIERLIADALVAGLEIESPKTPAA